MSAQLIAPKVLQKDYFEGYIDKTNHIIVIWGRMYISLDWVYLFSEITAR